MPFDIGFIELCILLVVGLMVLGPDKLPVAARQLSKWFAGIRRHVNSFSSEMNRELEMDELRREFEAQKSRINEVTNATQFNKDGVNQNHQTQSKEPLVDLVSTETEKVASSSKPVTRTS
ncbi:Sec-independent protein translocase protein TatB [Glaciecola sp. XM2]|jgi:sec-independent protein translocase protein TatB|uniref:Sec-independent protein translocase protein TatB n=1 Tax=Glaciecola sp. XM2 TaxID=1914931 RepID=UPI001BDF4569|nr:Sec-independent protein translocase protein TatB [Glaciecola sp. XM2]MBT1449286.1 Sec-independent protein translocase protein TatB [Glaciecola sp. XM2]